MHFVLLTYCIYAFLTPSPKSPTGSSAPETKSIARFGEIVLALSLSIHLRTPLNISLYAFTVKIKLHHSSSQYQSTISVSFVSQSNCVLAGLNFLLYEENAIELMSLLLYLGPLTALNRDASALPACKTNALG